MKILLITNYWRPWNCAGTMRWLQLGRYLDFDVLTQKQPRKGFKDETLPRYDRFHRVFHHFSKLPGICFGLFIIPFVLARRYDLYIFTIPPFSSAFSAYVLAKLAGRNVMIDTRDNLDGHGNRWPILNKIFWWFGQKIERRTTSFQFLDPGATRILSGYNPEIERHFHFGWSWEFIRSDRMTYDMYNLGLSCGHIPDFRDRMNPGYAASSFVNLKYLNVVGLPIKDLHPECAVQPVQSWEESAKQMEDFIYER